MPSDRNLYIFRVGLDRLGDLWEYLAVRSGSQRYLLWSPKSGYCLLTYIFTFSCGTAISADSNVQKEWIFFSFIMNMFTPRTIQNCLFIAVFLNNQSLFFTGRESLVVKMNRNMQDIKQQQNTEEFQQKKKDLRSVITNPRMPARQQWKKIPLISLNLTSLRWLVCLKCFQIRGRKKRDFLHLYFKLTDFQCL